ncbi:hypothetical protein [Arenimonas sp.]|uniref:hypothetical protein n=1 Tax=Arenimonas sp. TaxID=1872635 RepID=UPI0039E40F3A
MIDRMGKRLGRGRTGIALVLALSAFAATCQAGVQELTGRVQVVARDTGSKIGGEYRYYLLTADKRRIELRLDGLQMSVLRTGATIRAKGEARGDRFELLRGSAGYSVISPAQPLAATSSRKVAGIVVDIVDGQGTTHGSNSNCVAKLADRMYSLDLDSLDSFMTANSYGAVGISGIGYPGSSTDIRRVSVAEAALDIGGVCKEEAWAAAADAQAAAAGLNLSSYQHRYYILPPNVGCAWAVQAYQACAAGTTCRSWIKGPEVSACDNYDQFAHAMGHNLGMLHAVSDTNNDGTTDGSDVSDPVEPTSPWGFREFNAPHREQMGWIGGRLATVASTGSYAITAIERQVAANPQALKISVSTGSPYYLSTRLDEGYDFSMPGDDIFVHRTAVHRYQPGGETRFITSLGDGQIFADPANGLRITQLSHNGDGVVAKVEKGVTLSCTRAAPVLGLQPSSVTLTAQGTAVFQATLTNKDSTDCGPSNFRLIGEAPGGWTVAVVSKPPNSPFGSDLVSLLPSGSMPFSMSFSPPAGASNGSYPIKATTTADAMHAAVSTPATVVINIPTPPCTRNKPFVSMTPASQTVNAVPASRDYTLTITNTDSQFCPATTFNLTAQVPVKWSGSVTPSTAALSPGAWTSAVVKVNAPATATDGTYTFNAGSAGDASHVQSRVSGKMVVAISGGGTCVRAAPLVSITPASQTLTALPGSASYSVNVTNQDSSVCAASAFGLSSAVPSGWSRTLTPSSLSPAPGASSVATLVVSAPTGASNATYPISIATVADGSHSAVQANATTIVNVSAGGGDTTPPTVPSNLKASVLVNKVKLSWNASSDGGTGVAGYRVLRNGALIATVPTPTYSDAPGKGVWSYAIIAFDAAGNASAASAPVTADVKR